MKNWTRSSKCGLEAGRSSLPTVIASTAEAVFPERCFSCRNLAESPWCYRCRGSASAILPPYCPICGEPGTAGLCAGCAAMLPAFDSARSVYRYEGAVRDLIQAFKFRGYPRLAGVLAEEMTPLIREALAAGAELVLPVPSEPLRQWRRGFNPPELFARCVAVAVGLPVHCAALSRRPGGQAQVGLDVSARRLSVLGQFRVVDSAAIASRNILLIDDVFTTGATASEAARTLKRAGALEVHVVTLARR